MTAVHGYLKDILANLQTVRDTPEISETALKETLNLGPGWIRRPELGQWLL